MICVSGPVIKFICAKPSTVNGKQMLIRQKSITMTSYWDITREQFGYLYLLYPARILIMGSCCYKISH